MQAFFLTLGVLSLLLAVAAGGYVVCAWQHHNDYENGAEAVKTLVEEADSQFGKCLRDSFGETDALQKLNDCLHKSRWHPDWRQGDPSNPANTSDRACYADCTRYGVDPELCARDCGMVSGGDLRDGSKVYRDNPGGDEPPATSTEDADDGLPATCKADQTGNCSTRWRTLSCSDRAKYYFNQGEANMAVGDLDDARNDFSMALRLGRKCGSEYAVLAAKRLSALNLTCEYTPRSLARISKGVQKNPDGGEIIDLRIRKQALKALGDYSGAIDLLYDQNTREAIQRFQRDFGFSETGDLTPIQTVYLICSATENANDTPSTEALGVMYLIGLGVVQNTDLGLRWLKIAGERGDPQSLFDLAIAYGTGIVRSSYKVCDVVESAEIADSFLQQASDKGHPTARKLVVKYGGSRDDPKTRWRKIAADYQTVPIYRDRLEMIGQGCSPN